MLSSRHVAEEWHIASLGNGIARVPGVERPGDIFFHLSVMPYTRRALAVNAFFCDEKFDIHSGQDRRLTP
jgi:hypothetical protein